MAEHDTARLVAGEPDTGRSYDDLPESDVATVLQVPLLWSSAPVARAAAHTRTRPHGRHRATPAAPPPSRRRPLDRARTRWARHPLATAVRVGVVSAVLVLAGFAAALLALAVWLP